ncbi:MAG: hypothetical protein ACXV2C_00520 [Candidatus Bathyarchaeia archaeon]
MPNITIVYDTENVYGENEAAYDTDTGELIHWWNCNDASWRGEYLEPLFEHYGFTFGNDPKGVFEEKFRDYLRKEYADEIEDDEEDLDDA